MKAQQITGTMINHFQYVLKTYEQAVRDVEYYEKEYNDLNHALELLSFNAAQGYHLAKELQTNRRNRRVAKDTVYQLEPLYNLFSHSENFHKQLKIANKNVIKIAQSQSSRTYKVRVRTDMQKAFDKANGVI